MLWFGTLVRLWYIFLSSAWFWLLVLTSFESVVACYVSWRRRQVKIYHVGGNLTNLRNFWANWILTSMLAIITANIYAILDEGKRCNPYHQIQASGEPPQGCPWQVQFYNVMYHCYFLRPLYIKQIDNSNQHPSYSHTLNHHIVVSLSAPIRAPVISLWTMRVSNITPPSSRLTEVDTILGRS